MSVPADGVRTRRPRTALRRVVLAPPVLAVAGAVLLGALVMAAAGVSPGTAYPALVNGAIGDGNLPYTIASYVPTLGMALAFALPFRAGECNLGGDGQLALGGIAAAVVALKVPLPGVLAVAGALIAAVLAGALTAGISGPLATRLGLPAIITTLLLSTPATALASYLVRFPLAEKGTGIAETPLLPERAHLPTLGGSEYVTAGLPIILLVTLGWLWTDGGTVLGYEIRALGAGREFARYGGLPVARLATSSLAAGGALAGLSGALIVLAQPYRYVDGALTAPGYTFTGVAAVLLAAGRPRAVPVTAALLTVLQVGGEGMERDAGVPGQLTQVLEGLIILIVAVLAVARRLRRP